MQDTIWNSEFSDFHEKLKETNLEELIKQQVETMGATDIIFVTNEYVSEILHKTIRKNRVNKNENNR